jgi:hypothetical protein
MRCRTPSSTAAIPARRVATSLDHVDRFSAADIALNLPVRSVTWIFAATALDLR